MRAWSEGGKPCIAGGGEEEEGRGERIGENWITKRREGEEQTQEPGSKFRSQGANLLDRALIDKG